MKQIKPRCAAQTTNTVIHWHYFGILCFLRSDLSHMSGVQRERKSAETSSAHLSILFSITVPSFYCSNFLEPSIKPSEVEPEAGTIIA